MRNALYTVAVLTTFVMLYACKKDHHGGGSKLVTIDTTIASGADFYLDLRPYGDADDVASISKQGVNYTVSEINNSASGFAPVYHYSAISKTAMSDQVVLKVAEGSHNGNAPHHSDSTMITINFTIQ